jgi:TnpA family transposase
LRPLVDASVSVRSIQRGWDAAIRIAASVEGGWCPATIAIERLGSAASDDSAYKALNALGKLHRTIFLCDYWSNASFRGKILDLLNQGESVHSLQRAIHHGLITAKRGRAPEELAAISGSLALLTNIIMAFNTQGMQRVVDRNPSDYDLRHLMYVAPVAYEHINLRGTLSFDLAPYRSQLFESAASSYRHAAVR